MVEHLTVNQRVLGSKPSRGAMRVSYIGITPAFQAGETGSIPVARSIHEFVAQSAEQLAFNQ
jgi:hypothetical protein